MSQAAAPTLLHSLRLLRGHPVLLEDLTGFIANGGFDFLVS